MIEVDRNQHREGKIFALTEEHSLAGDRYFLGGPPGGSMLTQERSNGALLEGSEGSEEGEGTNLFSKVGG